MLMARARGGLDLDPAGVGKTSHRKHAFFDTTPHIPDPLANFAPALHHPPFVELTPLFLKNYDIAPKFAQFGIGL